MSIPAGVSRVALVGTAPSGEIFNTGFWINGAAESNDEASTVAGKIVTEFASHQTNLLKLIRPDAAYTNVRVYSYPAGGPHAEFVGSAPIVGGAGTSANQALPLQVCVVASLLTQAAGRSGRGRMYLPASAAAMTTTHQLDHTLCTNVASDLAAFFAGVNDEEVGQPSVVSQKGAGAIGPIGTVRIDTRFDIQRRRANKQAAEFSQLETTGLV